jgi:transcriptional regulator with XRE-family HTH domain
MNSVERVKTICKDRKIPISKLERDLGYSNGYIGQLRKGTFPNDRLKEIAEYLEVSIDYLMTGKEKEGGETYYLNDETRAIAQEIFENKELRMLFDVTRKSTPQRLMAYYNMIKEFEGQEHGKE